MTTRLYFHLASSAVGGTLPTAAQSTLTADVNGDAQTVNRKMNTTVGAAQGEVDITTNATASRQNLYFTKFVSEPIYQSSVAANTWTYGFCAWTIVAATNYPVDGTNKAVYIHIYVWRPSDGSYVGAILDGNTAATVDEGVADTDTYHIVNLTGLAVPDVQNGDVIVVEIWFQVTQANATARATSFMFDGANVYTDNAESPSGAAAGYIETPETLNFTAPVAMAGRPYRSYSPRGFIPYAGAAFNTF